MRNKKGFTLVELILVMAVTTILLGTIVAIFLQSIDMYKTDETKSANQSSLNMVSSKIDASLRKASDVYVDGSGCHIVHSASEEVFSLNTTTKVISINGAYLTDRITEFTCTNNANVITVYVKTINDIKGSYLTYNSTIVLRQGE